ncbi:MAG: hypothetical protein QGG24_06555 [Vicinamibacterales bacterium]|jgi:hypothetical protein|nr:hypothetical protein [Acidobacteriota bacterium]MDP7294964.1 hypothetical protein [Vicinamibacterales bacterium]MDP7472611.1 hypothetical protein [Vicinamibacterales bacterium]MDP7670764.1 hypothetical protein [Vicinamibacterales bacterium]HJO37771.1 hypothetical protein [Vicinamibacterales bacterium]|tara:strand:+ start:495 stop:1694 length:1200 start_codon:yes stop_codon:yes gene_type:complete
MKTRAPIVFGLLCASLAAAPASAQQHHLIVVSGLGGAEEYRDRFHDWSIRLVDAAIERHGISADQVVYLAERPDRDPERIQARSTWENVQTAITAVAERAAAADLVLIVLIGHGSSSGGTSQFNVPGLDPTVGDFAVALDELRAQRVVFVNTASASGEFVAGLSGPNRTIVTATKTARERNETKFGGFFVDAIAGPASAAAPVEEMDATPAEAPVGARVGATILMPDGSVDALEAAEANDSEADDDDDPSTTVDDAADANKDGRTSLLEAFEYARREVARVYEQDGLLLTEHAMLDDNGDGEGSDEPDPVAVGADGRVAQSLFFTAGPVRAANELETDDPALLALYAERRAIEERVEAHRMLKDGMETDVYEQELERLLIELALKNRQVREAEAEMPER